MAIITIFLTNGSTWTVPSDWDNNNNTIECLGAGANGTRGASPGGGGGGYAKITNLALVNNTTIPYNIGISSDNTDTWFNGTSMDNCSVGAAGASGSSGGLDAWSVGDVTYSGGNAGACGGGAAGPQGNGLAGSGSAGGAGDAGFGGAGSNQESGSGGDGTEWGSGYGSGGGGGPGKGHLTQVIGNVYNASASPGGPGGWYGAGGGCGATKSSSYNGTVISDGGEGGPGLIKITYKQLFPGKQFQAYIVGA